MKVRLAIAALALAGLTSLASADITGKVTLDGKPPEMKEIDMSAVPDCAKMHADPVPDPTVIVDDKGGLKNVVVSVKQEEGKQLPGDVPKETAEITQKGCMYEPHVVALMTGQKFEVKNDDACMHNVHSLSMINPPFNFAQPTKGATNEVDPFKAAEYFMVKCDVHPWMTAQIAVFEHPYFAITKADGTFDIPTKGLPDGDYTINFWHEKYAGDADNLPAEKVTVKDGKAEVNHVFKAESAMSNPTNPAEKSVILASIAGKKPPCCDTSKVSRKPLAAPAAR